MKPRVLARIPLLYGEGPDASLDRPAHVRAGSGCCFVGDTRTLAVVQDDAHFLALVDVDSGVTRALTLPPGPGGLRQFDAQRGNKPQKMDLEACAYLDDRVVLFGSGSSPARERVLFVDVNSGDVETKDMHALYEALRAQLPPDAELNIEGAVLVAPNRLRLFQRGNGRGAVDATIDVPWPLAPKVIETRRWTLGDVDGVRLTFTDATQLRDGRIVFLAAAEASPNAIDDGVVVGCALGVLEEPVRVARIPYDGKPEGIAADPDPSRPNMFWLVVDKDAPEAPAELVSIVVE